MDLRALARQERADLAELLAALSADQWEAPSLCTGWRVRDVVAHVISYDELDARGLGKRLLRARMLPDRMNALGVADYNARTPDELVEFLRDHLDPHGLAAGFGGAIALTDCVIHQQDIRRPLGIGRDIPDERLRPVLRAALTAPPIRGAWNVRGVRMVATDIDWAWGQGPEVSGPGEAVLMAIGGRSDAVADLAGPGRARLARRFGAQLRRW